MKRFNLDTKIDEVLKEPVFDGYQRLIFPVRAEYYTGNTLGELRLKWYNYMSSDKTVEIMNRLYDDACSGREVFFDIYSEKEKTECPEKRDTGLFFLRGKENAPFAVCVAGGNYEYVGAMHDSFPHALEISNSGLNAFVLIYRQGEDESREDLARALAFIFENSERLGVDTKDYSLWGGSAGAKIAAWLSTHKTGTLGQKDCPLPCCAVLQYTSLPFPIDNAPAVYINMGTRDEISNIDTMLKRMKAVSDRGTDTQIEIFEGMPHGYGIALGTEFEGWTENALAFWEKHRSKG